MRIYDLAVVGAGPAGLAAATYASNIQLDVVIIAPDLGGKVAPNHVMNASTPRNLLLGADLVAEFTRHIQSQAGIHQPTTLEHISQNAQGYFELRLRQQSEPLLARSIIIASGVKPQRLYVPGEEQFWGKGVSYSALSHAPLFVGRDVAVVGQGERALAALLKLASIAKQVYWIPIGEEAKNQAQVEQISQNRKITSLEGWHIERITGEGSQGEEFVSQIELQQSYSIRYLPIEGVFIEMGLSPNTDFVQKLLALKPEDHIPVNQHCETRIPGLFAAGDVTDVHAEQVPVAIGEGVKAAISAWEWLIRL